MIPFSDQPTRRRRTMPVVMLLLMVVNVLVFLWMLTMVGQIQAFFMSFGVIPYEFTRGQDLPPRAPYGLLFNLLAAMFIHGGFLHIASNMLYLWVFGDNIEDALGHFRFLAFYLVCGLAASAAHILFNPDSRLPSVGASGAIAGVLGAYLVLFSNAPVRTLIFLGPFIMVSRVSAALLIGFWFVVQLVSGLLALGETEQTAGVAFWAHIGGFLAGLFFVGLLGWGRRRSYE